MTLKPLLFAGLTALVLVACVTPAPRSFPEPVALPQLRSMPDPLVMLDGRAVTSRRQWMQERRPELKALFEHYMYGPLPGAPRHVEVRVLGQYADFFGGEATLKLLTLETGPSNAPRIDLLLIIPNRHSTRVPVFLAMNFCGNHSLTSDPRVPLTRGWLPGSCKGCTNNAATETARGAQSADWPLEEMVRRGYGFAAFYSGDIDSDRPDVSDGVYAWQAGNDASKNNPASRGTIAAWAWGFQRCMDYLVGDRDVDPRRIVAVGHSRNGKAALLAAALDERIAMAIPHQAGCGGSAPSRGTTGESVQAINERFPHWFNARFKEFNAAPGRLPFDQNCLVALCAPRPVLFTAAADDQWSNPAGQFEVLRAADGVYRFLGSDGLAAREMPAPYRLVDSPLGYHIREGKHAMKPEDWGVFMDYTDKQLGKSASK